jgi:hypothetical protein
MAIKLVYLHGPKVGQTEELEDEVYAKTLLDTGYAYLAPPPEPVTAVAKKSKKSKAKKGKGKKATTKAKPKRKGR